MNCQQFQNQFDNRLDGRLDSACAQAFDAHTAGVHPARRNGSSTGHSGKSWPGKRAVEPSFGFAQRTLRRLHEVPERSKSGSGSYQCFAG